MMKKITSTLILLFIMLFAINVKAGYLYNIVSSLEKSEDTGSLYNLMPTEVKKGDIVTVHFILNGAAGWNVTYGFSTIGWDKEAFELVETNGKYYTNLNSEVGDFALEVVGDNKVQLSYGFDDIRTSNKIYLVDLNFKVKKDTREGIYKIYQEFENNAITVELENDEYETLQNFTQELKFQVGNVKVTSNYTIEDIEEDNRDVYVIGNHMFTRDKIDGVYDGTLFTEYIMLAAKSIESNNKDDMIIYLKNVSGKWKNAINDEDIAETDLPESFKITYINTQANYLANGLYTDNNEKTILRIIQINEEEAIVTIEDVGERVHGIANMEGNVATLTANGKNYQITLGDDTVTITTTDSYITNKNLTKRTNISVTDYFNDNYADGIYDGFGGAAHYINSVHSGEYSNSNYELTVLRVSSNVSRICLREKNTSGCLIGGYAASLYGDGTYYIGLDEASYELTYDDEKITIGCEAGASCNSEFYGIYNKDKSLTMEDAFHTWEKNEVGLKVMFDPDNGEDTYPLYVTPGQTIMSNPDWEYHYSYHDKEGMVFDKWLLNGEEFDFDTAITEPITLVASYKPLPGTPDLYIVSSTQAHDYFLYENDLFYYHLFIDLDEYDGYDVFEISDDSEIPVTTRDGEYYVVSIDTNATKIYMARAYVMSEGEKWYGPESNRIIIHPVKFTVTFDTVGGSQVPSQIIPYGGYAIEPDSTSEPLKNGFTFTGWEYEGEPFEFETTPITGDITITATWENNITRPVISRENIDSIYHFRLSLGNHNDYCSNLSGECNKLSTDNYWISGYEIYEIVGNTPQIISLGAVTQFKPYESIEMTMEPNTTKRFVMKVYIKEGAVTSYSNDSAVLEIDTTIPTPTIAFNPNGGEPDPLNDVENWIEVTNLDTDFVWTNGYTINGFELANKVGENDYQSIATYGIQDVIKVTASYGDERHYAIRAFAYDTQGEPKYGDYSNILDLDTTAPATAACYVDGDNVYHWSITSQDGWTVVPGVTNPSQCVAPVSYTCYVDGDDGYHWSTTSQDGWTEVPGVDDPADCHAPVTGAACYFDDQAFEYHWTDAPEPGWQLFPGITDENTCK